MSEDFSPEVCRVLLLAALALAVLLFTARDIEKWWSHSLTARVFRIHVRAAWWYVALPVRLIRRRFPAAHGGGGGASPTPVDSAVVHHRRVVHVVPLPAGGAVAGVLTAHCGEQIKPGEAERLDQPAGMPCTVCALRAQAPNVNEPGGRRHD